MEAALSIELPHTVGKRPKKVKKVKKVQKVAQSYSAPDHCLLKVVKLILPVSQKVGTKERCLPFHKQISNQRQ